MRYQKPSAVGSSPGSRLLVPKRYSRLSNPTCTPKDNRKKLNQTASNKGCDTLAPPIPKNNSLAVAKISDKELPIVNEASSYPGQNLLRNVCVLLNHVGKLQKQNQSLHQQVLCLGELCEIEKMKNLLFHESEQGDKAEKTPMVVTTRRPPPQRTADQRSGNNHWSRGGGNRLALATSSTNAKGNASCRLNNHAAVSYAPRLVPTKSTLKEALLNQLKMGDNIYETLTFATSSAAAPAPSPRDPEALADKEAARRRRDRDGVFMELNFPQVPKRVSPRVGLAGQRRPVTANFDEVPAAAEPDRTSKLILPSPSAKSDIATTSSPTSKFWSKFSFKKFGPTSPLSKISKFTSRQGRHEHHSSASDSEIEKIASLQRVQIKKRKRKISDSESFTSGTETSGLRHQVVPLDREQAIISPYLEDARNAKPLPAAFYRSRFDAIRTGPKSPKAAGNIYHPPNAIGAPGNGKQVAVQVHVTHAQSDTDVRQDPKSPNSGIRGRLNAGGAPGGVLPKDEFMATSLYTSTEAGGIPKGHEAVTLHKSPSQENMSSLDASLTISDDSVFMNDVNQNGQTLLHHVMALQQKNAVLAQQLKDKCTEHDVIVSRFLAMEAETSLLKQTYKFDTELQRVYYSLWRPSFFVPSSMVCDLQGQIKELDARITEIKSELFKLQQKALESDAKLQANSRQYLDELETLQKEHYAVLKSIKPNLIFDDEVRRVLDMLPSYNSLYSFAIRMIKALKQMRSQMLEKSSTLAQMDVELLQTQSSLLIAHAQSERQRIELRFYSGRRSDHVRHTWHGDNLAQRLANSELSFYLPFRLHGCRIRKPSSSRNSGVFNSPDAFPEAELIQLFKDVHAQPEKTKCNRVSEYASTPVPIGLSSPVMTPTDKGPAGVAYRSKPGSSIPSRNRVNGRPPPIYESIPLSTRGPRPRLVPPSPPTGAETPKRANTNGYTNGHADSNTSNETSTTTDSSTVEIPPMLRRPVEPSASPPSPLPLGNAGQVRNIARAFEHTRPPPTNAASAPVSPVKPSQFSRIAPPTRISRGRTAPRTSPDSEAQRKKTGSTFGLGSPIPTRLNGNGNSNGHQSGIAAQSKAREKSSTLPSGSADEEGTTGTSMLQSSSGGSGSMWSIAQEKVSKKLFQRRGVTRMPKLSGIPKAVPDCQVSSAEPQLRTFKPLGRKQAATDDKCNSWMQKLRSKK